MTDMTPEARAAAIIARAFNIQGEVLVDDARRLHARLRAAGIPAQLQIVSAMEHVAVTRDTKLPGAAETFEALAAFVDSLIEASI